MKEKCYRHIYISIHIFVFHFSGHLANVSLVFSFSIIPVSTNSHILYM